MAYRKPPNPWSEKQVEIGLAVAAFAAGVWFRVPAVGIYVAAAIFTKFAWPKPEEIYDIESPAAPNAVKAQMYARHLMWPIGKKTLFGPTAEGEEAIWPPVRASAIWAAIASVCWGAAHLVVGGLTGLAVPFFWADPIAFFLLAQALAAGSREAAYMEFNIQGSAFPAATINKDLIGQIGTTQLVWAPVAAGGTAAAVAYLAAVRITGGIEGVDLAVAPLALGAAVIGIMSTITMSARSYISAFNEPLRERLRTAQLWTERWISVRLGTIPPPIFMVEHSQPPAEQNLEETHKMAVFQVPSGATIEDYKGKTDALMSAVYDGQHAGKVVLVAPMVATGPDGQPQQGVRNEHAFRVYYSTAQLPPNAHLATGMDNWTTAFVIQAAFDRAFAALKLGMPDLVRPSVLVQPGSARPLYETIWALPKGVTYEMVMKKSEGLREKIGADWFRIGRRARSSDGRKLPETAISIAFGAHPDHVQLRNPAEKPFLEALDLHAAFFALGLGAPLLENARPLTRSGHPTITEAQFRLSDKIDWGAVIKKTAALREKIEVDYLRITRREEDGVASPLVSIIYGSDPIDTVLVGDPPDYDPEALRVGPERNRDRLFLDGLDWDDRFRSCKLIGTDGRSPSVVSKSVNKQAVASYEFRFVQGLPLDAIKDQVEALKATSGLGYIEVEPHPKDAGLFRLLAAKVDPLDRPYLAIDYHKAPKPGNDNGDPVLHAPIKGEPDIDWVVGPGAEGDLLVDRWEGDNPHLFLGGASGSGKALSLDTVVPTPNSSRLLGDLEVGDTVLGGNHVPCTVTGVSPVWDDRPAYRVEFTDGTSVVADAAHDWVVDDLANRDGFDGVARASLARSLVRADGLTCPPADVGRELDDCDGVKAALAATGASCDGAHVRDWILETYAQWAEHAGRRRLVTTEALAVGPNRWAIPRSTGGDLTPPEVIDPASVIAGIYAASAHGGGAVLIEHGIVDVVCDIAADAGIGARKTGEIPFAATTKAMVGLAAVPDATCPESEAYGRRLASTHGGWHRIRSVRPVARAEVRCIEVDSPDHTFLITDARIPTRNSITTLWMLLQLMNNNHPDDVKFALADPKTELVYFEDAQHVNHFLGLNTPGFMQNPYAAMADLLEHLKEETYRRNQSFTLHPAKPQKLSQARFLARQEIAHAEAGTTPEGWPAGRAFPWWSGAPEDHPFMLPYQFIIIEECSTFFKQPANKEQRGDYDRLIGHIEELARIARSAGMHIAAMTQYPKKENIPTTLLAQCRRIGLKMNRVGSMLTIEESGLQDIDTPGRGKMSYGKHYKGVRCLFVRAPDEKDPDAPNDRDKFFAAVPRKNGPGDGYPLGGRLPGTTGPTVTAAAPPDPTGVWLPRADQGAMAGVAAPDSTGSAPTARPVDGAEQDSPGSPGDQSPDSVPGGAPDHREHQGPRWDTPAEEFPDLDELLADL